MSKRSLLDIVQEILSAMDSDEVNSIGDTTEALQVAREVRTTYEALVTPIDIPEHDDLTRLEAVSDLERPNYLRIPDDVKEVVWIKYNYGTEDEPEWHQLEWVTPDEFLRRAFLKPSPTIQVPNYNNIKLPASTDTHPRYWTSFDDQYIVCDDYDMSVDDTLQGHKTLIMARISPVFRLEDDFVPDLDANLFPLLMAEAKNACFVNLKQVSNGNEERRARRYLVRVQSDLHRTNPKRAIGPDYARRGRKG